MEKNTLPKWGISFNPRLSTSPRPLLPPESHMVFPQFTTLPLPWTTITHLLLFPLTFNLDLCAEPRLIHPTVSLISLLGSLINISSSTWPKLNFWSSLPNLAFPQYSPSQLTATPCFHLIRLKALTLSSLIQTVSKLYWFYPSEYIQNPTPSHTFHCYHLVRVTVISGLVPPTVS